MSLDLVSQDETKKWYFGDHAGLDFSTNPPTALSNGAMNAPEGSASISDAAGNLLFYTEGVTLFNSSHLPMANGTMLQGDPSTSQSSLIIQQPGSTFLYYLFTLSTGSSYGCLRYSVIDMSMAAGSGSVTLKNIALTSSLISISEKLTATKHCNGTDYWIVVLQPPNYNSFLLTSTGINPTPVTSPLLSANIVGPYGCMKISPNGKKLVVADCTAPTGAFELLDFNNSTGVVSNSLCLGSGLLCPYGVEFSPDGTKIYGTTWTQSMMYQWDLCAGTGSAVVASMYTIPTATSAGKASLQLAPDGKIYAARYYQSSLGVINNPNAAGAACNYSEAAISLGTKLCLSGLPNFAGSLFYHSPVLPPFTFTVSNSFGCQAAAFSSTSSTSFLSSICSAANYSLNSFSWDFGEPSSGASNTSTLSNPMHTYFALGTYTVSLILHYSCSGGDDTIRQIVNINQPCIAITSTSVSCANLGSATVVPTGGIGPFSFTWMPSAQVGSVVTNLNPGNYTLTVFDLGNNYTYTTPVTFTPMLPLTGNVNSSSSITCNGAITATANVTGISGGSGNVTYQWFNATTTYTSPSPLLSAGIWSVTVTDVLTGCQINQSFYISQPPALILSFSPVTPTSCVGTTITLTAINSGGTPGYTYTWTPGPASTTRTLSETTAGTYIYSISSTDANNCLTTNTVAVNFIPNPTLSVSDVSVCPFALTTLIASGATSYTWSSGSLGSTFASYPANNQQYSVVGSALGCTNTATANIFLKQIPIVTAVSNSPRCNGDQLLFNAYGGISYFWSGPNGFTSTSQNPGLSPASLLNTGVYHVTVTAVNGCTASASNTVLVNPSPPLSLTAGTVCVSQTLNFSANSSATTFTWTGPQNFNSNLQNPFIVHPSTTSSGTYTVKATSALGCTNTAYVYATVLPIPVLTIAASSKSMCAQALNGSPTSITLSFSGANTYTLHAPTLQINNPSGPISSISTQYPFSSGINTVTVYGSNGACTASTTTIFSVIPNPSVTISAYSPTICAGENFTYNCNGALNYIWEPNTRDIHSYSAGSMAIVNPATSTVFSIYGGSLGCNSASQTSTVTVNPLPTFIIVPEKAAICLNEHTMLTALGNASSYTWAPYNNLSSMNGTTVNAGPTVQQTYTLTGTLNSCTSSAVKEVSVLPLPSPTASILKSEVCLNDLITLQGFGGEFYDWQTPGGSVYAGQTATLVANSRILAGTYVLTATDKNGCRNTASTYLLIHPLPGGSLNGSAMKGCVPFFSDFMYSPETTAEIETRWELNGKEWNAKNFSFPFITAGNYIITGTFKDVKTTCVNTQTFLVEALPKPSADFTFEPEKPVENLDEINFINTSTGEHQTHWNWYFVSNKGFESENKNTNYLFTEAGLYPVAMVVTNAWGCADTSVKNIKVEVDLSVYVPNVFTPNADYLNDIFLPVTRAVSSYELSIFDRWGERVFFTKDVKSGWDGTFKGEPCKADVYAWKIYLSSMNGEMKTVNGNVMLSR